MSIKVLAVYKSLTDVVHYRDEQGNEHIKAMYEDSPTSEDEKNEIIARLETAFFNNKRVFNK